MFTCNGPVKGVHTEQSAKAAGNAVMVGHRRRIGCGASLSEAIDALPGDGKEHEVKCSVCGNISRVRKTPSDE